MLQPTSPVEFFAAAAAAAAARRPSRRVHVATVFVNFRICSHRTLNIDCIIARTIVLDRALWHYCGYLFILAIHSSFACIHLKYCFVYVSKPIKDIPLDYGWSHFMAVSRRLCFAVFIAVLRCRLQLQVYDVVNRTVHR